MKAFDKEEFLEKYWRAVLDQQADELPYFSKKMRASDGIIPGNNLP